MRGVSQLLELVAAWGVERQFNRDDLSYLPIDMILAGERQDDLRTAIEAGRQSHNISRAIRLPHIIADVSDIYIVRMPLGQPNYITSLSVAAPPQLLTNQAVADIAGKIVLIESADPGFDWIFAHGITGLITKYGGVNSHMAIRSAEFGLPAAIGCGSRLFDALTNASAIELDCAAQTVRPIGERVAQ
jgi:phosphohistidine swiveling domain-containing protein